MIRINRSEEVPRVLVESTDANRYRHEDVVRQLVADSHGKCYLCEIGPVFDPEVEHRLPHENGRYPERKYDWNNLFYSCRHCNTVKNKPKYASGIIDCCARDPEAVLSHTLVENVVSVVSADSKDREAVLTAELIEEIFMAGRPPLRQQAAASRLGELQKRMNALFTKLAEYGENRNDSLAKRTLVAMLDRSAAFAGFTRCYVRENIHRYSELARYLQ